MCVCCSLPLEMKMKTELNNHKEICGQHFSTGSSPPLLIFHFRFSGSSSLSLSSWLNRTFDPLPFLERTTGTSFPAKMRAASYAGPLISSFPCTLLLHNQKLKVNCKSKTIALTLPSGGINWRNLTAAWRRQAPDAGLLNGENQNFAESIRVRISSCDHVRTIIRTRIRVVWAGIGKFIRRVNISAVQSTSWKKWFEQILLIELGEIHPHTWLIHWNLSKFAVDKLSRSRTLV